VLLVVANYRAQIVYILNLSFTKSNNSSGLNELQTLNDRSLFCQDLNVFFFFSFYITSATKRGTSSGKIQRADSQKHK
jgi:hypothetical protein